MPTAGAVVCLLLPQVCRLFDLFLATHPLMPLYVGAAAMHSQRQQLLAAEEMPMLHSKLVNLSVTKMATADQLAIQVEVSLSFGSGTLAECSMFVPGLQEQPNLCASRFAATFADTPPAASSVIFCVCDLCVCRPSSSTSVPRQSPSSCRGSCCCSSASHHGWSCGAAHGTTPSPKWLVLACGRSGASRPLCNTSPGCPCQVGRPAHTLPALS